MDLTRRQFFAAASAVAISTIGAPATSLAAPHPERAMYGLIGRMIAVPGQREALAEILLEGTQEMPGCLSYVVAFDTADPHSLWITEVWEDQASHAASLSLPAVRAAIEKGRPLIAGSGERFVTTPTGGHGLA